MILSGLPDNQTEKRLWQTHKEYIKVLHTQSIKNQQSTISTTEDILVKNLLPTVSTLTPLPSQQIQTTNEDIKNTIDIKQHAHTSKDEEKSTQSDRSNLETTLTITHTLLSDEDLMQWNNALSILTKDIKVDMPTFKAQVTIIQSIIKQHTTSADYTLFMKEV